MTDFDENREWANKISEKLEHATSDTIIDYLEELESKWKIPNSIDELLPSILNNFNIENINQVDANLIETEKNKIIWEVTGVNSKFTKLIKSICESEMDSYRLRWEKVFESIYYSERFIRTGYLLQRISQDNYDYSLNEDSSGLFKFVPINNDKNTPYQNLLLYILEELNTDEFARYGEMLYRQVKINRKITYAWKPEIKIRDYIFRKTKKEFKYDQWKNATAGGNNNIKAAEQYLQEYEGPELMSLVKDRHLFAFKNGNYITKWNVGTDDKPIWTDVFVPYGEKHPYLNITSVACKYFDQKFDNFENELNDKTKDDWFNIIIKKCPNFKKIMDFQEFNEDVQKWLCIYIGRCGYEICDLDNWAAIGYLLGQANSGKSTILTKIVYRIYEEEDIGMISNNIEKKYGLKPHLKKFLVLAPEIDDNFQMEQTDWQLVVEGGRTTFAEKFKNAESDTWTAQMMMSGNKLPGFSNNSGSVSRRMAVWNFSKTVIDTDTHLDKKLDKEMPFIMKLCITAYLDAVNKFGNKGIWKILPDYFLKNKDVMEQTTNSLQNFLKSGKIIFDENKYVPEKVFKQAFNDHCRENNLNKEKFTSDYYSGIFINMKISLIKRCKKEYPINSGINTIGVFFSGVDVINDDDSNNFIEAD